MSLSRRSFLRSAAALGAGAALPWARAAHAFGEAPVEARAYFIMHTIVEVVAVGDRRTDLSRACEEAATACRAVERRMNFFDPRSELSRLNAARGGEVSVELACVLREAKQIHRESDSAFDAASGALVLLYRKARESGRWPDPEEIEAARASAGMDGVELDGTRVRLCRPGALLDLSGIAKGHAVDRAVAAMRGAGARGGMVNAGGDLFVFGTAARALPAATIQDPADPEATRHRIALLDEALATSGDAEQGVTLAGRFCSHLIDPATGLPVEKRLGSASVRADSAMHADAWASALYVRPSLAARSGVESLLIGSGGDERASKAFFSNKTDAE